MSAVLASRSTADPVVIANYLRKMQLRRRLQTFAALIGGAALALLGPMCVLLFYLLFSMTLISSYGFWRSYLILSLVTLPIFFAMALYVRGSVLERWVPDGDSLSGRFMRRCIAPALVILEIANTGPRLVIWGCDQLKGRQRVKGASLPRIAEALAVLLKSDSSISPAALLRPGEPAEKLAPLLAFLLFHQMVDISKQGDRVWLLSYVKQDLQEALRTRR